jgi:ribosomal protein S2
LNVVLLHDGARNSMKRLGKMSTYAVLQMERYVYKRRQDGIYIINLVRRRQCAAAADQC